MIERHLQIFWWLCTSKPIPIARSHFISERWGVANSGLMNTTRRINNLRRNKPNYYIHILIHYWEANGMTGRCIFPCIEIVTVRAKKASITNGDIYETGRKRSQLRNKRMKRTRTELTLAACSVYRICGGITKSHEKLYRCDLYLYFV